MTREQRWFFLVLGIVTLTQLAARSNDYDDEANVFHDIVAVSEAHRGECLNSFEKMMKEATSNLDTKNMTHLGETINKITQDFLSCIFTSEHDAELSQPSHDSHEVEEIFDLGDRSEYRRMAARTKDDEDAVASKSSDAINQIQDFLLNQNYDRVSKWLQGRLHEKLKDFVNSGLDKDYRQVNYVHLMKKMLYELAEAMLSEDLIKNVKAMLDKRLEPYITGEIDIEVSPLSENPPKIKKLTNSLNRLKDSELSELPECIFEDLASMIGCVYVYVKTLVMMESTLQLPKELLDFWEPFGVKLLADLERLLVKIIDPDKEDKVQIRRFVGTERFMLPHTPHANKIRDEGESIFQYMDREMEGIFNKPTDADKEKLKDLFDSLMQNMGTEIFGMTRASSGIGSPQKSLNDEDNSFSSTHIPSKILAKQLPPLVTPNPTKPFGPIPRPLRSNIPGSTPENLPIKRNMFSDTSDSRQ